MALYTIDNRPGPIDFECNSDILARTIQNCKNLLMCRKGEVPYDRMRGLNPAIFDLSIQEANEQILPEIERILGWEPDAQAVSAKVEADENGNTIITMVVKIDL